MQGVLSVVEAESFVVHLPAVSLFLCTVNVLGLCGGD